MDSSANLLHDYQVLSQTHAERFDPALHSLQAQIEQQLQALQQQEEPLVQQQQNVLNALQDAIATDARWLMGLSEFQQYLQNTQPRSRSWSTREIIPLDPSPLNWEIYTSENAVQISNFEEDEELDDYDDERTHASYGYTVQVKMGTYCDTLYRTTTRRVYGIRDTRHYNLEDQREQLESAISDLFYGSNLDRSIIDHLSQELSYLVGYACQLFMMKPRRVEWCYSPAAEESA
ncbi:MAG: hypothetical protein MUF49_03605 [Oculatellaceae cyanobacterium Prado106]|nr:hypothetical protein [Oculatellaceae cyanobacterium Prado106]